MSRNVSRPADTDPDDFLTPVVGRQLLRCDHCQRTDEATHADLMRYLTKGWPSCCDEVMSYFIEAPRPSLRGGGSGPKLERR